MSSSSSPTKTLSIGIIGFGTFAQFLAKRMVNQGHTLSATSRSDYSNLSSQLGIKFSEIDKFMDEDHDVILICTSILSLSEVLKSVPIHQLKKPTLVSIWLELLPEDFDVLCTHPMFGPNSGKNGWNGLPFVYDKVRIRNEDICSRFLEIFQNEGCRMVEMSCEEHDKLAARSQFLTHTVARVLSEMEIESTTMDTKGFQNLVQLKETLVTDSFDLYSGLFVHNRFAKQELKNLELALETVKQKLLTTMDDPL
ncbi:hypothetical protein MKW92_025639 [Papaver armeniacum]|nr:hypothetical protein MKW92_025639 [Papaver armeniacum]